MPREIERKYLVNGDFKSKAFKKVRITQGYLCSLPERTVRVRVAGNKGRLTIKGESDDSGASRFEWERELPLKEAQELLEICEPGIIEKNRFYVSYGRHTFEVDEFLGDNEGLVIAEIELESVDESFEKPVWLGKEVTGEMRYYNSSLIKNPVKKWTATDLD